MSSHTSLHTATTKQQHLYHRPTQATTDTTPNQKSTIVRAIDNEVVINGDGHSKNRRATRRFTNKLGMAAMLGGTADDSCRAGIVTNKARRNGRRTRGDATSDGGIES